MKKALLILLSIIVCFPSVAQNTDENKSKVLSIKKSKEYIYGEGTGENEDDCYAIAKEKLMDKVKTYIANDPELSKADGVVIDNVKNKTKKLTYERTLSIKVVCLYVKKSDIIPIYNSSTNSDNADSGTSTTEKVPTISIIPPKTAKKDKEKKKEEKEEKKTESAEQVMIQNPSTVTTLETIVELKGNYTNSERNLLEKLIVLKKYNEVKNFLSAYKENSRNILYRLEKSGFAMRECYWVVFDKNQNVIAILNKDKNVNILTNSSVSSSTYNNYPKYWIQIYE